MLKKHCKPNAQTMIEYLLLLSIVVIVALVSLSQFMPRVHNASNVFFNRASVGILGEPNPCGDGNCWGEDINSCCMDCAANCAFP